MPARWRRARAPRSTIAPLRARARRGGARDVLGASHVARARRSDARGARLARARQRRMKRRLLADQLGHAAAVRSARGAGEPDAEASGAARMGIVGRVLRPALAPLQPGRRSRRAAAGAGTASTLVPVPSLEERLFVPGAVARRAAAASCCRTRNGSGLGARRARRARWPRAARSTCWCRSRSRGPIIWSACACTARRGCRGSRISAIRGPTARICAAGGGSGASGGAWKRTSFATPTRSCS